ncbi:MAG: hypothetical protein OEY33_08065 [Bdellovibrionales bacterium]|nr:hypothetical protein [Bdellovibrionales bacterium]
MRFVFALFCVFLFVSCSSVSRSVGFGASVGALSGVLPGLVLNFRDKSKATSIGLLAGGALGAVGGYFVHRGLESRDSDVRKRTLLNLEEFGVSIPKNEVINSPTLTKPIIESRWIDSEVQGKKLIEGHREWIISEEPKWVPNEQNEETKK